MKKIITVVMISALVLMTGMQCSYAGEIDILVQKLVDKGILTPGEAQQIVTETREEVKKEIAKGESLSLPSWLQKMKMKGDFRLRYQHDKDKGSADRDRARIRARVGIEAKINNKLKAGVGIATGTTGDPRSTNMTLGGSTANTPGSFKSIILDYAYGEYTPFPWVSLIGGKFKNPIWQPSDLLWDGDLNPEGGAINLSYSLPDYKLDLWMNNMFFIMDESRADKSDPFMFAFQPGLTYQATEQLKLKAAIAFYYFNSIKGKGRFSQQATNSLDNRGRDYIYNYNSLNPSVELSMKDPIPGFSYVPYAAVFGDFVYNMDDPNSSISGYDVGLKFGHEKVSDWAQWQAKVIYSRLGRDAWLDIFPDSDRYFGRTNMKAWELALDFGLGKNTWLGVDYYYAKSLTKTGNSYMPNQVLQVDWNMKW